jgi:tetratricopeptide (TPR) repeat protein
MSVFDLSVESNLIVENAICRNLRKLYHDDNHPLIENAICRNLRILNQDFNSHNHVNSDHDASISAINYDPDHNPNMNDETISIWSDDDDDSFVPWTDSDDDQYTENTDAESNDADSDTSSVYGLTVLHGTNEIVKKEELIEYIGISIIGRLYFKRGNYCSNTENFDTMEKYYNDAVEIGNLDSMINYAIHNETICKNYTKAAELYLMAIDLGDSDAMYNLADMYQRMREYEKMIKYYDMAIEYGDKESILCLFKYYQQMFRKSTEPDIEKQLLSKMIDYYSLAVKSIPQLHSDTNTHFKKCLNELDVFQRKKLWEFIGTPQNEIAAENYRLLISDKDLIVYENKVRLFESLNHVSDCAICLETKLLIDIHCGHTFCTSCYPSIYTKNCPLCRISP